MFLVALLGLAASPLPYTPVSWARDFGVAPRIPLVADIDHDGKADLIAVYPAGDSVIDVSVTVDGIKAGRPIQALAGWSKDCVAACAGEFDAHPGADVCGVFEKGKIVRIAHNFANGKFEPGDAVTLPKALKLAHVAVIDASGMPTVWSESTGDAYRLEASGPKPIKVPKGLVWMGFGGGKTFGQDRKGHLSTIDEDGKLTPVADNAPDVIPALSAKGDWATQDTVRLGEQEFELTDATDETVRARFLADLDGDGTPEVVTFSTAKKGPYPERTWALPLAPTSAIIDTDKDGLPDVWENGSYRGLNFKEMGCKPGRTDLICLISRFDTVEEGRVKKEMDRAIQTYANLDVTNPDGSKGFTLHILYRDPIKAADAGNPWWVNRDKFLPAEWRGICHWMQISPGGGGQADQMGDGGGCGQNAMWAVFMHEFAHQNGMDHNGFWGPGLCPIYRSMMNYAYSYSLEDDYNKIRYSNGELGDYVLRETDLDETIPLPYEKVKFLERGPYRFRLKKNGDTTLIDWNWNGIFGEKHIRADINYSYSTNAGARDPVDKTMTAPWLFVHSDDAYVLYGQRTDKLEKGADPNISATHPGKLLLRKLIQPTKWEKPITVADDLIGDPVALSVAGRILYAYQTPQGVVVKRGEGKSVVIDSDPNKVPTVGQVGSRTYVFLWNPDTHEVTYRTLVGAGKLSDEFRLYERSTVPVGMAVNTVTHDILMGMAQDQDAKRKSRWQIRRYQAGPDGRLSSLGFEWVSGETGASAGMGRVRVLFAVNRDTGPDGRIYLYGKGMHGTEAPWCCTYVAESIADKTVNGGWLVKRFYDEWTQTRSAPAATWFNGDVLWAYRWVDGSLNPDADNGLQVGYRGLGIDLEPMGDFDDISFLHDFGIRNSIVYLSKP